MDGIDEEQRHTCETHTAHSYIPRRAILVADLATGVGRRAARAPVRVLLGPAEAKVLLRSGDAGALAARAAPGLRVLCGRALGPSANAAEVEDAEALAAVPDRLLPPNLLKAHNALVCLAVQLHRNALAQLQTGGEGS